MLWTDKEFGLSRERMGVTTLMSSRCCGSATGRVAGITSPTSGPTVASAEYRPNLSNGGNWVNRSGDGWSIASQQGLPVDGGNQLLRREHPVVEGEFGTVVHRDHGPLHQTLLDLCRRGNVGAGQDDFEVGAVVADVGDMAASCRQAGGRPEDSLDDLLARGRRALCLARTSSFWLPGRGSSRRPCWPGDPRRFRV